MAFLRNSSREIQREILHKDNKPWLPVTNRRVVLLRTTLGFQSGLIMLAILILSSINFSTVKGQQYTEYDLKAVFLYNFAQFVEWPPEAFPDEKMPLVIGVLGIDPFGPRLDEIVREERVHNRKLVVQRYLKVEEVKIVHILFISQSERRKLDQILAQLRGRKILTVSDIEGFTQRGGIIGFFMENNKIRLRINLGAAKLANLTLSSKLLRVAETVANIKRSRRWLSGISPLSGNLS